MTLMLDPRYRLVWRTPDSLQLGVDNPPVVLDSVTLGHERMLWALSRGLTPSGLALIGTESGLTVAQVEEFRRKIQPALVDEREPLHALVEITGTGPTVERLTWRLTEAGLEPHPTGEHPDVRDDTSAKPAAELAVVVCHYVVDPEIRGVWLRRDVPHVPIVFGDTSAMVGPIIEPGVGPCLYCLELHHRDTDPAWPALAGQLLGLRGTAETPFFASEVATLATRLILNRFAGTADAASSITLDAETGAQSRRLHRRHPDCACGGLVEFSAPVLREIGTARSRRSADRSMPPTTAGAVSVPA